MRQFNSDGKNYAAVLQVGDSRGYCVTDSGELIQLTTDDSYIRDDLKNGLITLEEAVQLERIMGEATSNSEFTDQATRLGLRVGPPNPRNASYFEMNDDMTKSLNARSKTDPSVKIVELPENTIALIAATDGLDSLTITELEEVVRNTSSVDELGPAITNQVRRHIEVAQVLPDGTVGLSNPDIFDDREKMDDVTVVVQSVPQAVLDTNTTPAPTDPIDPAPPPAPLPSAMPPVNPSSTPSPSPTSLPPSVVPAQTTPYSPPPPVSPPSTSAYVAPDPVSPAPTTPYSPPATAAPLPDPVAQPTSFDASLPDPMDPPPATSSSPVPSPAPLPTPIAPPPPPAPLPSAMIPPPAPQTLPFTPPVSFSSTIPAPTSPSPTRRPSSPPPAPQPRRRGFGERIGGLISGLTGRERGERIEVPTTMPLRDSLLVEVPNTPENEAEVTKARYARVIERGIYDLSGGDADLVDRIHSMNSNAQVEWIREKIREEYTHVPAEILSSLTLDQIREIIQPSYSYWRGRTYLEPAESVRVEVSTDRRPVAAVSIAGHESADGVWNEDHILSEMRRGDLIGVFGGNGSSNFDDAASQLAYEGYFGNRPYISINPTDAEVKGAMLAAWDVSMSRVTGFADARNDRINSSASATIIQQYVRDGKNYAAILQAGTSRAYMVTREGQTVQISIDDSVIRQDVRDGMLTPEQAWQLEAILDNSTSEAQFIAEAQRRGLPSGDNLSSFYRKRNIATNSISKNGREPSIRILEVPENCSYFFVSSSGVQNNLKGSEISSALQGITSVNDVPNRLANEVRKFIPLPIENPDGSLGHSTPTIDRPRSQVDDVSIVAAKVLLASQAPFYYPPTPSTPSPASPPPPPTDRPSGWRRFIPGLGNRSESTPTTTPSTPRRVGRRGVISRRTAIARGLAAGAALGATTALGSAFIAPHNESVAEQAPRIASPAAAPTETVTALPSSTATETLTPNPTVTSTSTETPTSVPSSTSTSAPATSTSTSVPTATSTETPAPTATTASTATSTNVPPTSTSTSTPAPTATQELATQVPTLEQPAKDERPVIEESKDLVRDVLGEALYQDALRMRAENPELLSHVFESIKNKRGFGVLIGGLGYETGVQKSEELTDTILYAFYDLDANKVHMFNIPRDVHSPDVDKRKAEEGMEQPKFNAINMAYETGKMIERKHNGGKADKEKEQQAGFALFGETVQDALGLPTDFKLNVTIEGATKLLANIVGKVKIVADEDIHDEHRAPNGDLYYRVDFDKGKEYEMDAEMLMNYMRARKSTGEVNRNQRQQEVVEKLINALFQRLGDGDIPIDGLQGAIVSKLPEGAQKKYKQGVMIKRIWDSFDQAKKDGTLTPGFDLDKVMGEKFMYVVQALMSGQGGSVKKPVIDKYVMDEGRGLVYPSLAKDPKTREYYAESSSIRAHLRVVDGANPQPGSNFEETGWKAFRNVSQKIVAK